MNFSCTVISVNDIKESRNFYESLFNLEVYQDYGINISYTCGLSFQQDFDWLVGISKAEITKKANNFELCFEEMHFDNFIKKLDSYSDVERIGDIKEHTWGQRTIRFYDPNKHIIEVGEAMHMVINRFLDSGMCIEEVSKKMGVLVSDLYKLLDNADKC